MTTDSAADHVHDLGAIELDEIYETLLAMEARMHRDRVQQLQSALSSSRQIGVAIGLVMAQEGLGRDDAFLLLVRAGRRTGRRLRDVAVEVEHLGRLAL